MQEQSFRMTLRAVKRAKKYKAKDEWANEN